MIHLGPLPGSPGFGGDLERVVDRAVTDGRTLVAAGFDGLMVENFGDAPFFAEDVPVETVAAMTRAVGAVVEQCGLQTGVNVLRNDAQAALAVAAATGSSFIRVNVLSGTMFTDQGPIVGRAAEVSRMRNRLCPEVAVLADVMVKHAVAPAGLTLEDAARDLAERGGADAVVVSGSGTGTATSGGDLETVAAGIDLPVYVGSGATAESARRLLQVAQGVIVGSSLKAGGDPSQPIDPGRAAAFVAAATSRG